MKNLYPIKFPELLPEPRPTSDFVVASNMLMQATEQYVMGIDIYDSSHGAIVVFKKPNPAVLGETLVCTYSSRVHKNDFNDAVKRAAEFFNIPAENILKEIE